MPRAVLLLALALITAGCTSSVAGRQRAAVSVVTSTNVYADVVRQVAGRLAGTRVAVAAIIADPSVDPHSYEANVRDELAVSRADLIVENGGGYDDFIARMRRSANPHAPVLDAVAVSGRRASRKAPLNEHVWYDFATVARLAERVRTALSARDRTDAATFARNTAAFVDRLDALVADEARIRRAHGGARAAVTEPVPLYLLSACGLVDATPAAFSRAVESGADVPAAVLRRTLDLFTRHRVALLVYNDQTIGVETRQVQAAARSHHVPVVAVTETMPAGDSYLTWMAANLAAVRKALS